ncbi:MAG: hypothetical protein QOF51_3864 [Chloroflexota bacterium]|jgi:hypothetical protein|nr:hypothetical protein [Chloroflexota bacterium]
MSAMVSQATQATGTYVHPGANRGANARRDGTGRTKTGAALWTVQGLLALLFLFAGGMKLAMPLDVMAEMMPLSPIFMKFIGLCECLGAVGLVLPALLRIRPGLTPLAAAGLVIIMIGATTLTAATMGIAPALFPLVVGCLATGVAYGRVRLAPIAALA